MRFAVISIVALTILKLNSPVPILDTNRVAHADSVVSNFDFRVKQPQFPDRSKEIADAHQHDLNKEIAKEAARLQALEAQQKAQAVQTTTVAQNTPVVAQNSLNDAFMQLSYCEAGGDPTKNTGNGYYGMFQYNLQTWGNYMGYARPDLAPADVQLAKAKETQARRGWSPWPSCACALLNKTV